MRAGHVQVAFYATEALRSDRWSDEGEEGGAEALTPNPSLLPGSVGEPEAARGAARLSQVLVFRRPRC